MQLLAVPTPAGEARAHLVVPARTRGVLVLGHGAGGGIDAPDLVALRDHAAAAGWAVALVEQPYRVAGRRAPAPAASLDRSFLAVVEAVRAAVPLDEQLIVGGRSSGARVACRTAAAAGAHAVLALAFPLRPPGRPEVSRAPELASVAVPLLVVQGSRDPFGTAQDFAPGIRVAAVEGADHSFRARRVDGRTSAECATEVAVRAVDWLAELGRARRRRGQPET